MNFQHFIVAAAVSVGTTSVCGASEGQRTKEAVPPGVMKFVDEDKALLAYKSVTDGEGRTTAAIIMRHPKQPAPGYATSYRDRSGYSCELVMLRGEGADLKVVARSRYAVDCEDNRINLLASDFDLDDQLELSPHKVKFLNEGTPLGSYTNSFEESDGQWRLASATYIYTESREGVDGVLVVDETASYPRDFGVIPMERFERKIIRDAQSKNKSIVP